MSVSEYLFCQQERLTSAGKFSKGAEGGWIISDWKGKSPPSSLTSSISGFTVKSFLITFFLYAWVSFAVKESGINSHLDPPAPSHAARPDHKPLSSLNLGVQWAELAAIQSQLQIQSQVWSHLN